MQQEKKFTNGSNYREENNRDNYKPKNYKRDDIESKYLERPDFGDRLV